MSFMSGHDALVRADVLAPATLAAGFPLWLPFGTRIAERFCATYREELAREMDFVEMESPLLIPKAAYLLATSGTYDYQNMFEVDWPGGPYLLRPDNLVEAARAIAGARCRLPVLMQGSLYRSETERLRPLVRDRHIWCAVQVVHWVDGATVEAEGRCHAQAFSRFLRRIGLFSVHVENPPLRGHSRRGCYTYVFPDSDSVSLVATLYELAPPMVDRLGLTGEVLDFGFTTKLLAIAAGLHADEHGLVLSSSLAPDAVVLGYKTERDVETAEALRARIAERVERVVVEHDGWKQVLRRHKRRGTPLLVFVNREGGHKLIRRIDHASIPLAASASEAVAAALVAHDEALSERSRAVAAAALGSSRAARVTDVAAEPWCRLGSVLGMEEVPVYPAAPDAPGFFAKQRRLY
jgi:hypothetical protein